MKVSRRDLLRLGLVGVGGLATLKVGNRLRRGSGLAGLLPGGREARGRLVSAQGFDIVPRSGWGADESIRTESPLFAPVHQLFVHHTVNRNNDPDPAGTIRTIYGSHVFSQGFHDIAYNFLIDSEGRVYEGRFARSYALGEQPDGQSPAGMGVIGAHVLGRNVGSVGIGLLGDFTRTMPTGQALNALVKLLAWLADQYGLDPQGSTRGQPVIAGHRDANQTTCPGDGLYGQLPAIRGAVVARITSNAIDGAPASPTATQVIPSGVSATGTPRVTGQVSRSATRVDVTFSGSALLAGRSVSVAQIEGGFSVSAGDYGLAGLFPGTYTVQAVAVDAAGRASAPTQVATGLRIVQTPLPAGYWVLGRDGGVFAFGGAAFLGSTGGMALNQPVIGMASTPQGDGYWLVAADGGIFAYEAARFFGSTGGMRLNKPIVGISTSGTGGGYRLVASDGGIFSFGDAQFFGSTGSLKLNAPIVAMAATPSGGGYWLVASDGGIFSFGDAGFFGSAGAAPLHRPVVGIEPSPTGRGYWLVAEDGAVFAYGDAGFFGSAPSAGIVDSNITGMVATPTGGGYYLLNTSGHILAFGDAPVYGSPLLSGLDIHAIGMAVRP